MFAGVQATPSVTWGNKGLHNKDLGSILKCAFSKAMPYNYTGRWGVVWEGGGGLSLMTLWNLEKLSNLKVHVL